MNDYATRTQADYLGSVREHLNVRGVPGDRIGQHLEEMSAHLADTGASPLDEYGPADVYAQSLAAAEDVPGWHRWLRPVAAAISVVSLMLAIVYSARWTDSAMVPSGEVTQVIPLGIIGIIGATVMGARTRDQVRGLQTGEGRGNPLLVLVALGVAAMAVSVGLGIILDDTAVGIESIPGWLMALGWLAIAALTGWWSIVKPSLRPNFPAGSSLRTSMISRKVRRG